MKISVVYDEQGNILAAQQMARPDGGQGGIHLAAGPGQRMATFDAPAHLASKTFSDVAHLLRVNVAGSAHELVAK